MNLLLTQGNALQIPLADESVHMVCTSPPYWGLRDYGTATWEGGDAECDHVAYRPSLESGLRNDGRKHKGLYENEKATKLGVPYRDTCGKCGALRIDNQLGLEPTLEQYVENMVAVFREVRRVLRADGTLWLNLGDSYSGSGKGPGKSLNKEHHHLEEYGGVVPEGLKPKDLCGIPWRVAFALQADGWWLRSDIIWSKPNPMPESVTDRPTKAHEYLFLLTKSARYYYDADAVREALETPIHKPGNILHPAKIAGPNDRGGHSQWEDTHERAWGNPSGRNRRTVWHIATAPYSGAHFATYPPALVEPCIKAGTSERGVCPECGSPWERVVDSEVIPTQATNNGNYDPSTGWSKTGWVRGKKEVSTLGWQPTCEHDHEPIPATCFDPFAGSGTTLQVARQLGRNGVGLDLSAEYLRLARKRLSLDALDAWNNGSKKDGAPVDDLPMFKELP